MDLLILTINRRNGFPQELNKKLTLLSKEVLKDFHLNDEYGVKINFFSCVGCELMNVGIYRLRKLFVGLPFYFDWSKEEQIEKHCLEFFGDQAPNWKSADGKSFLASLILSDKAKKYAMGEKIAIAKSYECLITHLNVLVSALYSVIALFKVEIVLQDNKRFSFNQRYSIALLFSACLFVFFFCVFKSLADQTSNKAVDQYLEECKLNQDYIDGGIEYYTKIQARNLAWRNFLGLNGSSVFKTNGDQVKYLSKRYAVSEMIEKIAEFDLKFVEQNKVK